MEISRQPRPRRILIVGASIAGPALAHGLMGAGYEVTVLERAPAPREGGYKVDLRGAAMEVVRRMGLLEPLRALHTEMRGAWYVDDAGQRIFEIDSEDFGFRAEGDLEVMRGDLVRLLVARTRDQVAYRFGDALAALEEEGDGVRVRFGSGEEARFDLVVGADGLHSATRRLWFGERPESLHPVGYGAAIYTVPNRLGLDQQEVSYLRPGRYAGLYHVRGHAGVKAGYLFEWPWGVEAPREPQAQKRLLAELYAGAEWEVPWMLSCMDAAEDFYFDAMTQVKLDRYSRGPVVLLGDAAYCASPGSGQGTGLALVGAHILAGELLEALGDHAQAFARYEAAMRPFVAANQAIARHSMSLLVPREVPEDLSRLHGEETRSDPTQEASRAIQLKPYALRA